MPATDTPTRVEAPKELNFASQGKEQLLAALQLFFGDEVDKINWVVCAWGFMLALPDDARHTLPGIKWFVRTAGQEQPLLSIVADHIISWLKDAPDNKRKRPNLEKNGFRIISFSVDEHRMLTIIP